MIKFIGESTVDISVLLPCCCIRSFIPLFPLHIVTDTA